MLSYLSLVVNLYIEKGLDNKDWKTVALLRKDGKHFTAAESE
jgi:hypothetical protein